MRVRTVAASETTSARRARLWRASSAAAASAWARATSAFAAFAAASSLWRSASRCASAHLSLPLLFLLFRLAGLHSPRVARSRGEIDLGSKSCAVE